MLRSGDVAGARATAAQTAVANRDQATEAVAAERRRAQVEAHERHEQDERDAIALKERKRREEAQRERERRAALAEAPLSISGPSHKEPKPKKAPVGEPSVDEHITRLQWAEGLSDRQAHFQTKQRVEHAEKLHREAARAAAAEAAERNRPRREDFESFAPPPPPHPAIPHACGASDMPAQRQSVRPSEAARAAPPVGGRVALLRFPRGAQRRRARRPLRLVVAGRRERRALL